jgi:hypothetical protein
MIELDWLYTFLYTLDLTLTHQNLGSIVLCFGILTLLLISSILQFLFTRKIPLYSIDGENYLMEVPWSNKPVFVADGIIVALTFVPPNMTDPINAEIDTTKPNTGLENFSKVNILAEKKTLVSELKLVLFFLMPESREIWS